MIEQRSASEILAETMIAIEERLLTIETDLKALHAILTVIARYLDHEKRETPE